MIKIPPNAHLLLELVNAGKIPGVSISREVGEPEALRVEGKSIWSDLHPFRITPAGSAWLEKKIRDAIDASGGVYHLNNKGMTVCQPREMKYKHWIQESFDDGDTLQWHIDAAWYVLQ